MKIGNTALVKVVGALIVVLLLLGAPLSTQASPIQGGEVVTESEGGPLAWITSLEQMWEGLLASLGAGSSSIEQGPPDESAPVGPPTTTEQQTLTESPITGDNEARTKIEVAG